MKVLIPGITGRLARLVAMKLVASGHRVLGIDRRPWPDAPLGIEVFQIDIRKRASEDVFRKHRPDGRQDFRQSVGSPSGIRAGPRGLEALRGPSHFR